MKKRIVVNSKLGPLSFVCKIHKANVIKELFLSIAWFYKRHRSARDIPSFPHHEVELLNMNDFKTLKRGIKIHVHKSTTATGKKNFMCYTPGVPTQAAADLMWKAWCVGTVYSFIKAKTSKVSKEYDFIYPFLECKQDKQAFIDMMASKYNIMIIQK